MTETMRLKCLVIGDIAQDLHKKGRKMGGAQLAVELTHRGLRSEAGRQYKGGRGTYRLVSSAYQYAVRERDLTLADQIAEGFVDSRGLPAWQV